MHKQVSLAREQGTKLIFIDETVFTFKTFANKAWGLPYKGLTVPEEKLKVDTSAMIAGISEDTGLEAHLISPKSIKQVDFVEFIEKLSQKY